MNSITNKEDDFVDNQKAKRQKVGDENEKIRDHVMFSPTMDLHRTFPYQIMEPALSPPIHTKATNHAYGKEVVLGDHDYITQPIVLHVTNLDNHLNIDELERILRDTLKKQCKEVSFFLFKNSSTQNQNQIFITRSNSFRI